MDKLFVGVVAIISVLVVASLAYTLVNAGNHRGFSGLAISPTCTDSDGGQNYAVKGTAIKSGTSKLDYCSSAVKLVEYFCSNNNIKYVSYTCGAGKICTNGACIPTCAPETCISLGKSCGSWPNGCGGTLSCGTCGSGYTCSDGNCIPICVSDCAGKQCGSDGCGGSCGTCNSGELCTNGICVATCTPKLCSELGKQCGLWDNGCGSTLDCGSCATGYTCNFNGACICTPNCAGKQCGSNGCGGSCGICQTGYTCSNSSGACVISDSCSDTDGGIVLNNAGAVSGYLDGSYYSNSDYCTSSILVNEYYCSSKRKYSVNYNCTIYAGINGRCEAGACINQTG